jgi:hypothetical protein
MFHSHSSPIAPPVCRWEFQEPTGSPRVSTGRFAYALQERNGPIARADDDPARPGCIELREGQWLTLPRAECPALNLRGPDARVSVVAWVKRHAKSDGECQAVAGMWNETHRTRQYCLFLNLGIWESADQVCGHLSSTGAPSPGYEYCMEAAIGASAIPLESWHHVAFTFDGTWARAYLDGRLDGRPGLNPYFWPCAINDGGTDGSDFTVGAVFRNGEMGNWFVGHLGGLAVYDVALSPEEIASLHAARGV